MMSIIRRLVCERFQNNMCVCVCVYTYSNGGWMFTCCYAKVARDKI